MEDWIPKKSNIASAVGDFISAPCSAGFAIAACGCSVISSSGTTPVEGISRFVLDKTISQTKTWKITGTAHTPSDHRQAPEPSKNNADSGTIAPEAPSTAV